MDTSLKDFNDNVLYPNLFERIDQVFPEFCFKKKGKGWVSGNKLRLSGVDGSNLGSVIVYRDRPYYIKDFSSGGMAITKYLIERGSASSWIDAVKYLAEALGLVIPDQNISEEDIFKFKEAEKKANLFESINDFLIESLHGNKNALAYLEKRGFKKEMLRTKEEDSMDKVELGFLPSLSAIEKHLKDNDFTSDDLELIKGSFFSGTENRVSIPFRDAIGRIKGFVFRAIDNSETRYLYSSGLERSSLLFNLRAVKGDKDLVIVEGFLDSLHAHALGIDNVVALGGTSFNETQLKLAQRFGAEKITLCLDSDKSGEEATVRAIDLIKKNAPELSLYIASLPQGIKDPDELILKEGIESFKTVIKEARSCLSFQLDKTLSLPIDKTDKGRDDFLKSFRKVSTSTNNPSDVGLIIDKFTAKAEPFGITKRDLELEALIARKALEMDASRLKSNEERKRLNKTISEAKRLTEEGNTEGANELLRKHSKQNNTEINLDTFKDLLNPITREAISEKLRLKPDSLPSGYSFKGEELLIPTGAITILAAPTSHGKTSFLLNLAINVARKANDIKPVHFFSYEESQEAIILKALNTFSGIDISKNNRRSIEAHFKNDNDEYFAKESPEKIRLFKGYQEDFFSNYLATRKLNFHYVSYSVEELVSAIHYLKEAGEVGAVFIDYMQLLRLKNHKTSSRQEELKQICLDLKDCSVETGIPLILGAQFNRTVTTIEAIHPTAIGEAGDIERIANLILGFWNKTFNELGKDPATRPEIYAKILKGRDIGAGAEEHFDFNGNTGKISNKISLVKNSLF